MFDKLTAELGASRRLRVGLALIVAVLWLYGVLLLRDARDERTRGFRQASVQLARLQEVPGRPSGRNGSKRPKFCRPRWRAGCGAVIRWACRARRCRTGWPSR